MRGKSPRTLFELARQTWLGSRASLERSIERLERNHLFQWLSASTAKAVAASDMNLPEWLAGSRFFTTATGSNLSRIQIVQVNRLPASSSNRRTQFHHVEAFLGGVD